MATSDNIPYLPQLDVTQFMEQMRIALGGDPEEYLG